MRCINLLIILSTFGQKLARQNIYNHKIILLRIITLCYKPLIVVATIAFDFDLLFVEINHLYSAINKKYTTNGYFSILKNLFSAIIPQNTQKSIKYFMIVAMRTINSLVNVLPLIAASFCLQHYSIYKFSPQYILLLNFRLSIPFQHPYFLRYIIPHSINASYRVLLQIFHR